MRRRARRSRARQSSRAPRAAAIALALVAATATTAWIRGRTESAALPETRLQIPTPSTTEPYSFAISPDGRQVVFVASDSGQSLLWVRPLNTVTAARLTGTEGATFPFWSPDGQSVAFFTNNALKRIDIDGGPRPTAPARTPHQAG